MKKIKLWQSVQRIAVLLVAFLSMSHVIQAQSISISSNNTEIVLGESVVITAKTSSLTGELTWQSKKQGESKFMAIKNGEENIGDNPLEITPSETTEFRAFISNDEGNFFSNVISIVVNTPKHLVVTASKTELALGEEVTLRVESETGLPLGSVQWEKKTGNGTWEKINLPGPGESITDIPEAGSTCYRAFYVYDDSGGKVYSEEVCVTSEYKCASNSAYVIFTDDFGKLDSETARNSNQYVGSEYSYVSGCGWLKEEGTYAVMANARYGGCNVKDVTDGCGCTHASNDQMWFRDIYDHTQGGVDSENKYGGMLLVNADAQKVYSRTITLPCANTNLIFSAWFATASKGATSSVRFFVKDSEGKEIKEATFPIEDIDFADGWIKGETSFYTGDETTFTVEIHNYREGTDKGNDFLVDDISFSVCSPEIGLYAETASDQVEIDAANNMVQGPCDHPITLQVKTSMVDVMDYDDPQYLWFIKEADDTDFQLLPNANNLTAWRTTVSPYTQYYVVIAATPDDAKNYLEGKFTCTPVAVSNTITVLCTPNLEITLQSRKCSDIVLKGTAYDAPQDFYFWWEKSTDGIKWQKIPRAAKTDTLHYALSEPLYFRINSEYTPSDPTEKLDVKALTLKANPDKGISGSLVQLIATATNLNMDGAFYEWYRYEVQENPDTKSHWWAIPGITEPALEHTIERPVDRIMVTADGCEDTVLLKQVEFLIDPMERECNTIRIQPIATIGGDSINYKWQRSSDGKNWVDVLEENITKLKEPNCPGCVEISFSEESQFRIAAIDENGKETGLYSEAGPDEMLEVKKLELKAEPNIIKPGDEVTLTLTSQGFEETTAPEWYKDDELCKPITTIQLDKSASFEVVWDGCSDTAKVVVITAPTVAQMSRNCNDVTFEVTLTPGYGDFWWEIAKVEEDMVVDEYPAVTTWEKVKDSENKEELTLTITESIKVRVNNDYNIPSNEAMSGDVWTLTLDIDPKDAEGKTEIDRGKSVTLTATANFSSNNPVKWYQDDKSIENENNPYSPTLDKSTSFYVTSEGCKSNTVDVTVIQPVEIVVKGRECNNVTLEVEVEEGVVLSQYKWQISTFDSESSKWSDWSDYAGYVDKVVVSIDKDTKFQLVGDEISSEPTEAITYWSIELSIDKESIILGGDVTVTVDSKYIDASETILWYKNDQSFDYDGDVYTEKPYGPATYQVTQGGCPSNVVNVVEVVWPTIFTPMAVDGFNDDFIIGMEPRVALQVFDRYGNLVVETTDGWDGKDKNGKYALPGVYYYIATLPNGEVVKGNVELLNEKK